MASSLSGAAAGLSGKFSCQHPVRQDRFLQTRFVGAVVTEFIDMSKRHSLQPLPRRLSAENAPSTAGASKSDSAARPGKPISPSQHKKAVIEPRRIALKYASQTLVLEYKETETGKLRHRSFRIDVDRFETAAQCERKLWARLSKAVVPGSLQASQVGKLVSQLFQHEKLQNPDADELEQATERFMAAQVERPTPTKVGLKPMPMPFADAKANQLPEDAKPEKKVSGMGISSDKENSPNLDVAAKQGPPITSTSPAAEGSAADAESPPALGGDEDTTIPATAKGADNSVDTGLESSPAPARSTGSLLGDMPKLPGTLSGLPSLPGTLGGPVAGRRAGLQPLGGGLGGSMAGSGGFGSLTMSLGIPDDDDDDDDYKPPASQTAQEKSAQPDSSSAIKAASPASKPTPVSATSSNGSGAGRFLSVGVNSPVAGGDAKPSDKTPAPSDSFELEEEEEVIEDEDIPDYADDFEDDFEDEDDNDLSLPLPGSNAKDKVEVEKKAEAEKGDQTAERQETAEEKEERLRLRGDDVDLNQVEETELEKYKRLMEEEFAKNAIKPGDANWQHDVQVDFGEAEEECGWDEDDEEVDEEEDAF